MAGDCTGWKQHMQVVLWQGFAPPLPTAVTLTCACGQLSYMVPLTSTVFEESQHNCSYKEVSTHTPHKAATTVPNTGPPRHAANLNAYCHEFAHAHWLISHDAFEACQTAMVTVGVDDKPVPAVGCSCALHHAWQRTYPPPPVDPPPGAPAPRVMRGIVVTLCVTDCGPTPAILQPALASALCRSCMHPRLFCTAALHLARMLRAGPELSKQHYTHTISSASQRIPSHTLKG